MKNRFLLVFMPLLVLSLFAATPQPFHRLGDKLYNSVDALEKIKNLKALEKEKGMITSYLNGIKRVKEEGFVLQREPTKALRSAYLKDLRDYSKRYDAILRMLQSRYETAIENEDSALFAALVNSGFIDQKQEREAIIRYYFGHQKDIEPTGRLATIVLDAKLQKKELQKERRYDAKRAKDLAKIQRIRKEDQRKKATIEKKLQEELQKKRKELKQYEHKELSTSK